MSKGTEGCKSLLHGPPKKRPRPQTPLRELMLPRWIQGVLLLNGGRGNKGKRKTGEKKGKKKKKRENVRGRGKKRKKKRKKRKGRVSEFIGGFRGAKGPCP